MVCACALPERISIWRRLKRTLACPFNRVVLKLTKNGQEETLGSNSWYQILKYHDGQFVQIVDQENRHLFAWIYVKCGFKQKIVIIWPTLHIGASERCSNLHFGAKALNLQSWMLALNLEMLGRGQKSNVRFIYRRKAIITRWKVYFNWRPRPCLGWKVFAIAWGFFLGSHLLNTKKTFSLIMPLVVTIFFLSDQKFCAPLRPFLDDL